MNPNLAKFTTPGRIVFRDASPAPVAVLVSPYGSAEVSLYGAHVLSCRPTGHAPLLWLAESYKTLQPGKAIRGGIPVCWPWFGAAGKEGLPSHGFARTQVWSVISTEFDKDSTSVTFGLVSTPETKALWPHDFKLELTVTVGPAFKVELATTNIGDAPFEITEALHTYFRVKNVADASVTGLDGQPYIDKAPGGADAVQSGAVTFSGETDRVYNHHATAAIISDPGIGRRIAIEKDGSQATVVWNPWIEKAARLADMADDDWPHFVCVETANAGAAPVAVAPGARHVLSASITAVLLDKDGNPVKGRDPSDNAGHAGARTR